MSGTFLQIFLLVNVFLIGGLAAVAVQHAYAHFRPHPGESKKPARIDKSAHLPPEVKERLLQASQANFQAVLDRSAAELQHDLDTTADQLNKLLQKIGARVVGAEMERYQLQLEQIRKQAETAIGGAQDEIAKHQAELNADLEQQRAQAKAKLESQQLEASAKIEAEQLESRTKIEAEQLQAKTRFDEEIAAERQRQLKEILDDKQRLTQQIDTRLGDAVASFLLETLGHNVDLGAQTAYLTSLLEEHKADFQREVTDEA